MTSNASLVHLANALASIKRKARSEAARAEAFASAAYDAARWGLSYEKEVSAFEARRSGLQALILEAQAVVAQANLIRNRR